MGLIRFCKNIIYLFKYNLKEIKQKNDSVVDDLSLSCILGHLKYELKEELPFVEFPNIKNDEETIEHLIKENCSLVRYGDGEFYLMINKDIPFQKADKELSERLIAIYQQDTEGIITGTYYSYFHSAENLNKEIQRYTRINAPKFVSLMEKFRNRNKQYYSSSITQIYSAYKEYDFEGYFEKIKKIWENKDITIVCGKTVFQNIKNNIFDCAKSIEYIYAPRKDAWFQYDKILSDCSKIKKDRIVIIILGPTATVLAYDLHKLGYRALDFGHIAKDYDAWISKLDMSDVDVVKKFFKPD